jgi:hypothetical protein
MSTTGTPAAARRPRTAWYTSISDGYDHAVTDTAIQRQRAPPARPDLHRPRGSPSISLLAGVVDTSTTNGKG